MLISGLVSVLFFETEDGGYRFLRNVGELLPFAIYTWLSNFRTYMII
jgi:hypothetical protein